MDKAELERAIAELGLTQVGLADRLDLGERTIRRYLSGAAVIPRVVEYAIAYLLEHRHDRRDS